MQVNSHKTMTTEQIAARDQKIRRLYAEGVESYWLAKRFRVSQVRINAICRRSTNADT